MPGHGALDGPLASSRAVWRRLKLGAVLLLAAAALWPARPALAQADRSMLMDVAIAYVLGQPSEHRYAAVLDFSEHSSRPRFHVVDRANAQIVQSFLVAHGNGSEGPTHEGYADIFSNVPDSETSSLGLYLTGATYVSAEPGHGLSMRLHGLSASNSNAFERLIVVHGHAYMDPDLVKARGKAGLSEGCMVFSPEDRDTVVRMLKGGALIYAVKDLESLEP